MTQIAELELRYLHRKLAATDGTPTIYTASGGTVRTAISAALTEIDDYWNGSLVRWETGANAGLWSSVLDFTASSDTLTLGEDLPTAVANLDTFTLFQGGKHSSDQRVPGMTTAPLVNVTGFAIVHAAHMNGEGTGTLRYYDATTSLTWQPPGGIEGAQVDVSGLSTGDEVVLQSGAASAPQARSEFLQLERTGAALSAGDETDDISLDLVPNSFLARVSGTDADAGVTIYRPVSVRNTGAGIAYSLRVYAESPSPGAASTGFASALGTGAGTLTADDLTSWGPSGYIYNVDKDDVRYFYARSGNAALVLSPGAGVRGKTAVAWDVDDELAAYPWFDIGLDAPGALSVFEDPATRSTAPSGVTFTCPRDETNALLIGDLAAGGVHCIWLRFEIPADTRPLEGGRVDLRVLAQVTE